MGDIEVFIKTTVKYDCNFIQAKNTVFIRNDMYAIKYSTKRYLKVQAKNFMNKSCYKMNYIVFL